MGDYPYIVFSFLCTVLNIAPLCWHLEHHNSGPVCLEIWVIILNFIAFLNGYLWRNDAIDRAPVICDISSKIFLAGPIGLLCGNICIVRFLAKVVSPTAAMITHRDRRNRAIVDYCFSFGLPILVMATQIVYQPNRYFIFNGLGCAVTYVLSWPTYVLWIIWPPILAFVGGLFAVYVAFRLIRHRRDFNKLVSSSNSALNTSRFIRLGLLSGAIVCFTLPLSIITFVNVQKPSVSGGYINYGWDFIHQYFSVVTYQPFPVKSSIQDWVPIIAGLLVIIFFGFAGESFTYYGKLLRVLGGGRLVDRIAGIKKPTVGSPSQATSQVTQISLKATEWSGTASKDADADAAAGHAPDDSSEDVRSVGSAPQRAYQGPFDAVDAGAWRGGESMRGIKVTREEQIV